MRVISRTAVCALAVLAPLVSCAPRDAGFAPVSVLVEQRAGLDARWRHSSGDEAADARVRELLARPLGPEEAVQVAVLNNAGLQAAYERLGVARADLVAASRPDNVRLESDRRSARGADAGDYGIAATTDLGRLLLLPLERGVAQAGLDAARFEAAGAVLELGHTVRTAFYDYQAAHQLLELAGPVLEAGAAAYEIAQRLYDAGNITALELANERMFWEEARLEAARAEAAMLGRRETLNVLLGLAGADLEWQAEARLMEPRDDPPVPDDLEERAIAASVDLAALEHRYTAAARRANLARAQGWLPSLRAGALAGREDGRRETGALVAVEVPLFDQGQGEIERARAEMRQIEQQYRARAVEIRSAVRSTRNALVTAARTVEHYREVLLPLREEILRETQLQYNAMQLGAFQLVAARREQIRTGQAYVLALRDYWRVRSAVGQILAGRLVAVPDGLGEE